MWSKLVVGSNRRFWVVTLQVAGQQIQMTADKSCHCQFSTASQTGETDSTYIPHGMAKCKVNTQQDQKTQQKLNNHNLMVSDCKARQQKLCDSKNVSDHKLHYCDGCNPPQSRAGCDYCQWSHTGVIVYWDGQYAPVQPIWDSALYHAGGSPIQQPHIGSSGMRSHTNICTSMYQHKSHISM